MNPVVARHSQVMVESEDRVPSARWALTSLASSLLLSSLGTSIANVALPFLAEAFSASFQEVQWVVLTYLLSTTVLIVSVGRLGDIIGRRRLQLAGIVLFTVASLWCGIAPSFSMLIVARFLQGLGAAIMMALTMALVGDIIPKAKAGSAMGLLGTMSAIGTALGPSLGSVLISGLGWRAIFLINVPIGLINLILAVRHLPADGQRAKLRPLNFDYKGTLLLALTLSCYALAMTLGHGHFGALNILLLLVAIGGARWFVRAEMAAATPLIRMAMFSDSVLSASLAINAIVSTVMMSTLVVGPFYLSQALRLDITIVGIVCSVGPIVTALTSVPAGRLVERLGEQRLSILGLTGIAAGSMILSIMPTKSGVLGYIVPIMIITSGYALFQTANNTVVMTRATPEQRGASSGLLSLSRNLGLITGASVMGAVFALASATADVAVARAEAIATGMRITFALAAVLMVIALAILLRSRVNFSRHGLKIRDILRGRGINVSS